MNSVLIDHGGAALAIKVRQLYSEGQSDYSIEPCVRINEKGDPLGRITANDSVIFCCRRGEREIELTDAFVDTSFPHFERTQLDHLYFVILTLYHEKFKDLPVAFMPVKIKETLAEVISQAGLSQLHCSESEKFAHVTFFLNGGNNKSFAGETDIRVPSPRGIPFDQLPQMNLPEVVEKVREGITQAYDFIVTNFANGDVIGHTQNTDAKIACAQFIDQALQEIVEFGLAADYVVLVTADHGNIEVLLTEDGQPHVSHTCNPVPFIALDSRSGQSLQPRDGSLADIAPTILDLLGLARPDAMTGSTLVPHLKREGKRRVLLIILDGWGISTPGEQNPIDLAYTPFWDGLIQSQPTSLLNASGESVGLKKGKAGNSEAGHMNIGAGRVVLQDDVRLEQALQDGTFFKNETFLVAMNHIKKYQSRLHLICLLTEKSSHGSIDYPLALLELAKQENIQDVWIHVIFDGRSTQPGSAPALLEKFDRMIGQIGVGQIVSGVGRGLALDRDGNFAKIQRAYQAFVSGMGSTYR